MGLVFGLEDYLVNYCCVEGLRGNHIKFRPRRKPLLSSLKRARACKYRRIRNLYRAMYANWMLSTPPPPPPTKIEYPVQIILTFVLPPPPQRPEEQTPKTAETHGSNPCASLNMPHLAAPVHHTYKTCPPSFGDSGSSYILNTPPHLAISVHHVS